MRFDGAPLWIDAADVIDREVTTDWGRAANASHEK
jgi:hypothetical protein